MKINTYAAGLFDGEGSVLLSKGKHFRHPRVSVTSTTIELLLFLKKYYGGCISVQKQYNNKNKPSWIWTLSRKNCINFLRKIFPYMKCLKKRGRTKHILTKYERLVKFRGRYTDKEIKIKEEFERKFYLLK